MASGCPLPKFLSMSSDSNASNHSMEVYATSMEKLQNMRFVAYTIIAPIILVLGLLGNASNLVVLTRPNIKGVTFLYLTWLAVSDMTYLVYIIPLLFSFNGKRSTTYAASIYYAYLELPLANALMASSNFIIVALTVERFFSVCLPTKFKEIHNIKRAKCLITSAYLFALILHIPSCFQKMSVVDPMSNETNYIACDNPNVVSHPIFKVYLILKEIMVRFGPATILAVLNIWIIVTFRKTLRKRQELIGLSNMGPKTHQERYEDRKFTAEKKLINLLVGIVILFFISNTPSAIVRLLLNDKIQFNYAFQVFRAIANLLELSNMAMNFYFYFLCCPEIRRTFIALFSRIKSKTNDSSTCSKPSAEFRMFD